MTYSAFLLIFLSFISICFAHPLKGKNSIKGQIIDVSSGEFVSEDALPVLLRQSFTPSKDQAAGIVKSRIGFMKASKAGSAFDVPGVPGIKFTAKLSGSVKFAGLLANIVESKVEDTARTFTNSLYSFYRNERKNMQARAGGRFFWFFQAAANYGYTDNKVTRDTTSSGEFENFTNKTNTLLKNIENQNLVANYDVTYEGTSTGRKDRVNAFAYILINQIELDSGRILNVIKKSPELVVVDQDKEVIDKDPDGDVKVNTIDELTVDTILE